MVFWALAQAVRQPLTGPKVGELAPEFELITFDEETVRLSDLRGRVVVVNFWASWCKACAEEAADLEAVWREYAERGVTVVGVDYTDTRAAALAYIERHGITYPNGPDRQSRISRAYRIKGVPETFVIDRAGRIAPLRLREGDELGRERVAGPIVAGSSFTPSDLRALIEELLAEPAADG